MKRKRPHLSTIDPCHKVQRHNNTKLQVIDAINPEARGATVPVTATPHFTYSASVRHAQSSARGRTGRASSNRTHARLPSAMFSQPCRLCIADIHMPKERNLPALSRSRVAMRRFGRATKTGTCPPRVGAARHATSSPEAPQEKQHGGQERARSATRASRL